MRGREREGRRGGEEEMMRGGEEERGRGGGGGEEENGRGGGEEGRRGGGEEGRRGGGGGCLCMLSFVIFQLYSWLSHVSQLTSAPFGWLITKMTMFLQPSMMYSTGQSWLVSASKDVYNY